MAASSLKSIRGRVKRDAVCAALAALAGQSQPGQKLPTVNELCQRLKVSRATLDRALAQLQQQGVLVRRQGSGIFVADQAAQATVALLLGNDPFREGLSPSYRLAIEALRRRLASEGTRVELYIDLSEPGQVGAARRHLASDIEARRVKGGLLLGGSGPAQFDWLSEQGVPFVALTAGQRGWRIGLDRRRAIALGVAALADRGCVRPGLVSHAEGRFVRSGLENPQRTFQREVQRQGLPFDLNLCWQHERDVADWSQPLAWTFEELGYQTSQRMLAMPVAARPDGLMITDDMLARGFLIGLARGGVQVGRDLQLASLAYRGSSALAGFADRMLLVEFDLDEAAQAACQMLSCLMEGRRPTVNSVRIQPCGVPPLIGRARAAASKPNTR